MAATGNRRLKVAKYESVLERHPRDKEALTQLGMLHEGLEEYGKAIEYFERCLQVDNQDTDVLTSTGYCYLRTEDLAKALATYQRALYLLNNKATPRILYGLGVIYDRNEKWDTARSTFEQLLTAFPDFEAAAEVKLRLGSVCKLLGELDASCTWFEATLACPTCPPPFTAEDMCFELAQVLCMQGKFKEAEEVYARSERDREQRAEDGDVEYVSCNESEQWCLRALASSIRHSGSATTASPRFCPLNNLSQMVARSHASEAASVASFVGVHLGATTPPSKSTAKHSTPITLPSASSRNCGVSGAIWVTCASTSSSY